MKKSELRQIIREEVKRAVSEANFSDSIKALGANLVGPIKKAMAKPGSFWLHGRDPNSNMPERWAGMNKVGVIAVFGDRTAAKIWASSDLKVTGTVAWQRYVKAHPEYPNIGKNWTGGHSSNFFGRKK